MNEFTKASESVDAVINEYEELMNKTREILKEKMNVLFKAFFDTYPQVKTIYWSQYTPYFNDGDECVFSVNDIYFTTFDWEDVDSPWGEDDGVISPHGEWNSKKRCFEPNTKVSQSLINDMKKFSSILMSEANEAVMLAMFDNHVWVRAHRGGFEVDEYSHD